MPDRFTIAETADRPAVLNHIGDDVDVRVVLVERLAIRIRPRRIELAEIAAEREKLRVRQTLAVGGDDKARPPGLGNCVHIALSKRHCEIDAVEPCA
jgi:hypothetical protein